jgi:hypothetical protein
MAFSPNGSATRPVSWARAACSSRCCRAGSVAGGFVSAGVTAAPGACPASCGHEGRRGNPMATASNTATSSRPTAARRRSCGCNNAGATFGSAGLGSGSGGAATAGAADAAGRSGCGGCSAQRRIAAATKLRIRSFEAGLCRKRNTAPEEIRLERAASSSRRPVTMTCRPGNCACRRSTSAPVSAWVTAMSMNITLDGAASSKSAACVASSTRQTRCRLSSAPRSMSSSP